jgi:hypothetical protein
MAQFVAVRGIDGNPVFVLRIFSEDGTRLVAGTLVSSGAFELRDLAWR